MKRRTILLIGIAASVIVVLVCVGLLRHTKVDVDYAVRHWSLNKIRVLLWIKPGFVNDTDEYGYTPLHIESNGGSVDGLALLLAKGGNINATGNDGRTPLYCSVMANRKDEAEWLLEHGSRVNVQDDLGVTPLHLAVISRNEDMVELLLGRGASINAEDKKGGTPLYWATKQITEDMASKINSDERMVLSNSLYEADSPTIDLGFSKQTAEAVQSGRVGPIIAEEKEIVELLRLGGGHK
jgi:ankyrin repeat protein